MEWRLERGKKENLFKCVCVCVCTADICTHVPKEKGGGGGSIEGYSIRRVKQHHVRLDG